MDELKQFIKSYWDYFLELEEQFLETKRFVAFDKANARAYSIEYLKLYQAVCSEIDVVGKEIAVKANPSFKIDKYTNIKKWGYEVQKKFPLLKNMAVIFNDEEYIYPFKDWEYEQAMHIDKNNKKKIGLRIKDGKKTIMWWQNYNEIKHRRIGLVEGTKNFQLANQSNLIQAFSALFLLESVYINDIATDKLSDVKMSKLFLMVGPKDI